MFFFLFQGHDWTIFLLNLFKHPGNPGSSVFFQDILRKECQPKKPSS